MADEPTFQSSPVTKDGRYVIPGSFCDLIDSFNPRPSLRTGATAAQPVTKDGRYGSAAGADRATESFNPRPSLRTGATQSCRASDKHAPQYAQALSVSILARH
jgi:hypothetical protein